MSIEPAPLYRFTYKTWGGHKRSVEARRAFFAPDHVVFYDLDQVIVLAERNVDVRELRQELIE